MKKVIINSNNYEEIMFNILENNYSKEVRENLLDQIHADVFLNFEWQQWSKTIYSESTDLLKNQEAEFLESLIQAEEKKGTLITMWWPVSIAAGLILLIGVYAVLNTNITNIKKVDIVNTVQTNPTNSLPHSTIEKIKVVNDQQKVQDKSECDFVKLNTPQTISQINSVEDTISRPLVVQEPVLKRDSEVFVKLVNKPQPKYKITIKEETMDGLPNTDFAYSEKRYTMLDILQHKDGITLSKFLDNPKSRVIKDSNTQKTYIEYTAQDRSILVLTLSN